MHSQPCNAHIIACNLKHPSRDSSSGVNLIELVKRRQFRAKTCATAISADRHPGWNPYRGLILQIDGGARIYFNDGPRVSRRDGVQEIPRLVHMRETARRSAG